MTCPVCSQVNADDAATCVRCGAALPERVEPVSRQPEQPPPGSAGPPDPPADDQGSTQQFPAYGQDPYSQQQPYPQQPPYGQQQYPGQPEYPQQPPQPPYGQAPYGQLPYQQQPPYPQAAYGQQPYAQQPYPGQQPYAGQPPYAGQQGYPPPLPKKSHAGALIGIAAGVVVVLGAVAIVLVLTVFNKTVFDSAKMAAAIENSAQGKQKGLENVTCPSGEEVTAGNTFNCTSTTGAIRIVVKNDSGAFTWTPPQ